MQGKITRKREKLTDYRDDYWVCGKCKMCQSVNVQKVESARFSYNCPTGTRHRFESYYAAGMMEIARALTNLEFEPTEKTAEIIYSCNLCGLCQEMCYPLKGMHTTRIIQLLREKAVDEGWGPLPAHQPSLDSISSNDNPFGLESSYKAGAAKALGAKDLTKKKAETLFFVGCAMAAPEMREKLEAVGKVLSAGQVDFGVLGEAEPCCRSLSLMLGDRDAFEENVMENVERFSATGASRVVTACPHCLEVFRDEYSNITELEFLHISELVSSLIEDGKIKPARDVGIKAVYHDPCMLGRWCEVYQAPRAALGSVPGLELLEFERKLENSWCCGAGGGVKSADPQLAAWTAQERLAEAESVGAEALVTACPHCENQFVESGAKVYDICEILAMSL